MPVAKTYQKYKTVTEPYVKNGKMYVTIDVTKTPGDYHTKDVRWYSDREYARMYKEDLPKPVNTIKKALGFGGEMNSITIYLNFDLEDMYFRKEKKCRFHDKWGWYSTYADGIPENMPEGTIHVPLYWAEITKDDVIVDQKVEDVLNRLMGKGHNSDYIGEVGDRKDFILRVNKVVVVHGAYGDGFMHIMSDKYGNAYIWVTSSRALCMNRNYDVRGTIKDFRTYHGEKQTILTRCKVKEREDS